MLEVRPVAAALKCARQTPKQTFRLRDQRLLLLVPKCFFYDALTLVVCSAGGLETDRTRTFKKTCHRLEARRRQGAVPELMIPFLLANWQAMLPASMICSSLPPAARLDLICTRVALPSWPETSFFFK